MTSKYLAGAGAVALAAFLLHVRSEKRAVLSTPPPQVIKQTARSGAERQAKERFLHASLPFEANIGQTDSAAKFISRGVRYTAFFTDQSVVLRLADPEVRGVDHVLTMNLVGAHPSQLEGMEPLASRSHYYHGSIPKSWVPDVPHYGKVRYAGAYSDTDLVFYGRQGELEYDVVLGPGANADNVVLQFSGASKISLNKDGDLTLQVPGGREILQKRPRIYQREGGSTHEIRGRYRLLSGNRVRFEVGHYDRGKALIIDPVLSYSTYLGGSSNGNDYGMSIATDSSSNIYVAGYTESTGFPTGSTPPAQPNRTGGNDAFIAKLSADGTTLLYSTYLGGTADDYANGITVDTSGNAYVVGYTNSSDFPATPGSYAHTQPSSGQNIFIAKLSTTGGNLVFATYLGPGIGSGIAVDSLGYSYVTGETYCCSFPTTVGAYQRTGSGGDAFITKLNQTGTGLVWSTLLGGNNTDQANGIALDNSQNVYVAGYTYSTNFPTTLGAYQTVFAGYEDAFAAKLSSNGSSLLYSTLLGGASTATGNGYQQASGIAVDSSGYAYITGYTQSPLFPVTSGAFQTTYSGSFSTNAFAAKLNPSGSGLIYSTFLSSGYSQANAIAIDSGGNAYLAINGSVPATYNYTQNTGNSLVKLNASGSALVYAAQVGYGNFTGIAVDSSGYAYVTGSSASGYPVTAGAYQPTLAGSSDAIITKFNSTGSGLVLSTYLGGNGGDQGLGVTLDGSGDAFITGSAGSVDFPITTGLQTSSTVSSGSIYSRSANGPYTEAFVSELNPSGTSLLFSTFVGGSGNDVGRAITLDGTGAIYVTGQTNSSDFPVTAGAAQTANRGGYDAFYFKLASNGHLAYSTYFGGSSTEDGRAIALDPAGSVYIAGNSSSPDFPATSAVGPADTYCRVFVAKLTGTVFSYATVLGGSSCQYLGGLAVDASGSAYLAGYTSSTDFPVTSGAYQQTAGQAYEVGFISKLNSSGTALVYSTYLGGGPTSIFNPSNTLVNGIALDVSNNAYVTGSTNSTSFPVTAGALQANLGGLQNAFATKLSSNGSSLLYSTYLGGSGTDTGQAIAVDSSGNAYIAGTAGSANFPTTNGSLVMEVANLGNYSFSSFSSPFLASLNPSGTLLQYSTYLASSGSANSVSLQAGAAIVTGTTSSGSTIGPAPGYQKSIASGAQNAFVSKLSAPPAGCTYSLSQTSFSFPGTGGSGVVNVTTNPGCPWVATPDVTGFVQLSSPTGVAGSGSGSVSFTVSSLGSYSRVSLFTVAGQIISVSEASSCGAATVPTSGETFGPQALSSSFAVSDPNSCGWEFFTITPWITLAQGGGYRSGNQNVGFTLLPNTSPATRTGSIYVGSQTFSVTQLGSSPSQATIMTPAPGSTLTGASVTFTWAAISGADQYTLTAGPSVGQSTYCSVSTSGTSATCNNLPANGLGLSVGLLTHLAVGGNQPVVTVSYVAATQSLAQLLSPAPVVQSPAPPTTALPGTSATFTWSPGIGADEYWLDVGAALGSGNLCAGPTTGTSSTCSNLPCDGSNVYVQLWTHFPSSGWQNPNRYDYLACTAASATLMSPVPGSTLSGSSVTFKWNFSAGADLYWLDVGTVLGQGNLCAGSTSANQSTCNNIPTNGSPIYVQLWTHVNGNWMTPQRYTFTASLNLRAQLTSPLSANLPGPTTSFTWNPIAGADAYWLDVGTAVGQGNICALSTTATQYTCSNIPVASTITTPTPGTTIAGPTTFCWSGPTTYVQLWTHLPSGVSPYLVPGWQTPNRYTFGPPNADYWLDVGTVLGQGNISAGVVSGACQTVTIPSGLSTVYVQVWTRVPAGTGTWYGPIRYTYQ